MDEILTSLETLSILHLSHEDTEKIANFIDGHENLSSEALADFLEHNNYSQLKSYFERWFDVAQKIRHLNTDIAKLWEKIHKEPIISEDLLLLTVALLPDDSIKIESCSKKLCNTSEYSSRNIYGFLFANLHAACLLKLKNSEIRYDMKHLEFLNFYQDYHRFKKLNEISLRYLKYLSDKLRVLIETHNKIAFKTYYEKGTDNLTTAKLILDEQAEDCDILPKVPSILTALNKIKIMLKLAQRLHDPNKMLDINLRDVAEHYKLNHHQLNEDLDGNEAELLKNLDRIIPHHLIPVSLFSKVNPVNERGFLQILPLLPNASWFTLPMSYFRCAQGKPEAPRLVFTEPPSESLTQKLK